MSLLDRLFFPTVPALRLATLRVLVGLYGLLYLLIRLPHFLSYADADPAAFAPVGRATVLDAPLSADTHRLLVALLVATSLAFLVGLRHRFLAPLHALLLLWVLGYASSFGFVFHNENHFALSVLVLAFAPAADTLSLDARGRARPADDPRYGWAPRLLVALAGVVYFLAGVAKLKGAGVDFMLGEVLRNHIAYDNVRKIELGGLYSPLGAFLVAYTAPFVVLGAGSVALELLAPLAFFWARFGRWWALGMWAFHVGVLLIMAIAFVFPLVFVPFAPLFAVETLWERRPFRALGRRIGALGPVPDDDGAPSRA